MKAMLSVLLPFVQKHWLFFPFFTLFFLLLLRNPFSVRTLIPNLEPYPDSFYYIDSAFSFLSGRGFVIEREGRTIEASVPPLYALTLSPIFALIPDVRAFYFTNMALAFSSLCLFCAIVRKLFTQKSIQILLVFLYVTNPVLYWFPTLAMAENLLLPLYLTAVLLLITKTNWKRAVLAGLIGVAFYGTKYASLPLSLSFPMLYGIKLFLERTQKSKIHKSKLWWQKITSYQWIWIAYVTSLFSFGGILMLYEYFAEGNSIIARLLNIFFYVFAPRPVVETGGAVSGAPAVSSGNVFFSTKFMRQNSSAYAKWLIGEPLTMLWRQTIILPQWLAIPAVVGLFASLIRQKTRFIAISLLIMLVFVISFMSVFYVRDGRYFFIAIPTLFLGLGFFFAALYELFPTKKRIITTGILGLLILLSIQSAKQIKFQLALNIKYAETPWYFVAVRTFDEYLANHKGEFGKKPVIISALPPYLIDAYAKEQFILLPLDKEQEFRSYRKQAWGDFDFEHLHEVYRQFIKDGHQVFLTKYGLGNEHFLQVAFLDLFSQFETKQVLEGCYSLCNMYQLSLKK